MEAQGNAEAGQAGAGNDDVLGGVLRLHFRSTDLYCTNYGVLDRELELTGWLSHSANGCIYACRFLGVE